MSIISGLAGIKTATDLARALRDAAKAGELKQDEFAGRVGEIYDYIVDSKDALIEAKDQIQTLKSQLEAISNNAQIEDELEHDGYVYWRKQQGDKRSGPYCVWCWKKEDRLIPLTHILGTFGAKDKCNRYDCVTHGMFLVPTGEVDSSYGKPQSYRRGGGTGWMS